MGLFGRESQADVQRIERLSQWLRERHPLGLFSVLFGAISVVDAFTLIIGAACGVIAIIIGALGLRQIAQGDPRRGRRFCIAGMTLGAIGVTMTLIMATVVYPSLAARQVRVSPQTPASHARMLRELERIRQSIATTNPILGDRELNAALAQLQAMPEDAPAAQRGFVHRAVGVAQHKLGREREAIEHLRAAVDIGLSDDQISPDAVNEVLFRLGISYLRLAETQNCCAAATEQSCIFPLRGSGIHQQTQGSLGAIETFERLLAREPKQTDRYWGALWLLNLAYMTLDRFPDDVPAAYRLPRTAVESDASFMRLSNIAPKCGVDTFSLAGGVIADDFDRDGDIDLAVSTWHPAGQLKLFVNRGDGTFVDRTNKANLAGIFGGLNMIHGDYDNDGYVDILVLRGGWLGRFGCLPNSLLRNGGDGTFSDVTFDVGLAEVNHPTQTAAFADIDHDGDLDLYIGNETTSDQASPCQLFRNDGARFVDIAAQAGVTNDRFTKGTAFGDYDGDGDPDLYVSNLGAPNRLYRNNGDNTFTDVAEELGVRGPIASFPTWFWDANNDGALDLFVTSYTGQIWNAARYHMGEPTTDEPPGHYINDGQGGFVNRAQTHGLVEPQLPMGCNFGDLDGDGFVDMYLGTGYPDYASLVPNLLYRNRGGESFENVTIASGMGHLQKGHGVAFADFDGDGDLDVFEQMGGWFAGDRAFDALYENPGSGAHWIAIELRGVKSNRSAIGAWIRLELDDRVIHRHVSGGGSFGGNPFRQWIGLGAITTIDRLEIHWPTSATTQTFTDVAVDRVMHVVEEGG